MQFKVPQFLDIEDKIFGPFTFRQFVYLTGGAGLCFVLYKALGFWWSSLPILILASLSVALTFYRPNNKPFVDMLEAGFKYLLQSKLYLWKKRTKKETVAQERIVGKIGDQVTGQATIKLDGSKLRDLAWSLDVLDLKK